MSEKELEHNSKCTCHRSDRTVLVVGQYYDYKGMDLAFRIACKDQSISYKFVGMGSRTDLFLNDLGDIPKNVEIIPFLQKAEIEEEYRKCSLLLLPSRQECWGLVVNEAASYGTPIVSTIGSGAAVEFLSETFPQYLAKPGDIESLYSCIKLCLNADNTKYSEFLKEKSKQYSIERSVKVHVELINSL